MPLIDIDNIHLYRILQHIDKNMTTIAINQQDDNSPNNTWTNYWNQAHLLTRQKKTLDYKTPIPQTVKPHYPMSSEFNVEKCMC